MKKELTICMPIYNGARYLKDSIGSILGQTYSNFNFLCYDDGSTDDSVKIVKSFRDKRIKLIVGKENRGGIYARTQLINAISTEYCMWLDCDDKFHRNDAFEIAMNTIKQGDYDLVNFVRIFNVYKDGHAEIEEPNLYKNFVYCGDKFFEKFYPVDNHFLFNSKIFKTELLKKSIPEDEILEKRFCTDDVFFGAMWFFNTKRYCNIADEEPLIEYRKDVGIWGSQIHNTSFERIGELCVLLYSAFVSLYNRMIAIRQINHIELDNLIIGTNIAMICKLIGSVRKNNGDEMADSLMHIFHSAFAKDGVHLLNDIDGFECPAYIKSLENIMNNKRNIPIKE